jgi:hypothetical protein
LTIFKAKQSAYIFGGFTTVNWLGSGQFKSDPSAFLFSLTNNDNQPSKMRQINTWFSIWCNSPRGPSFGLDDIHMCNAANTRVGSHSKLGRSYEHLQPSQGVSFLAGSNPFQLSEIEVYKKE